MQNFLFCPIYPPYPPYTMFFTSPAVGKKCNESKNILQPPSSQFLLRTFSGKANKERRQSQLRHVLLELIYKTAFAYFLIIMLYQYLCMNIFQQRQLYYKWQSINLNQILFLTPISEWSLTI